MDTASGLLIALLIITIFSTSGQQDEVVSKETQRSNAAPVSSLPVTVDSQEQGNNTNTSTHQHSTIKMPETEDIPSSPQAVIIYNYIRSTRSKVPDYEAELIAHTITHYSMEKKTDPYLIAALIERESGFDARAISKHGAKGLGQLMDFNLKPLQVDDPYLIEQSVRGTVAYIATLLKKWKEKPNQAQLALASYLEGPNAIARQNGYRKASTTRYVNDIMKTYRRLKNLEKS